LLALAMCVAYLWGGLEDFSGGNGALNLGSGLAQIRLDCTTYCFREMERAMPAMFPTNNSGTAQALT